MRYGQRGVHTCVCYKSLSWVELNHMYNLYNRQWLRIRVDVPVAHWLRIRADNFYLFYDLSARIVRSSVCHGRSCGTSTRICSLPWGKWLRIWVDVLTIHLPVFVAHGLKTGKQAELDLCRYLHIGIGLAAVHRCPQLLASLENSSAELWKICWLVWLT